MQVLIASGVCAKSIKTFASLGNKNTKIDSIKYFWELYCKLFGLFEILLNKLISSFVIGLLI